MANTKPSLFTSLSPTLLHLYDASQATVVIIDVLRATSTIATALYNGARHVVPVDSVAKCIELGRQINCITAGERDAIEIVQVVEAAASEGNGEDSDGDQGDAAGKVSGHELTCRQA